MKKTALLALVVLAASLVGCGSKEEPTDTASAAPAAGGTAAPAANPSGKPAGQVSAAEPGLVGGANAPAPGSALGGK